VPVLVSDRKRITVMAGETPLYDASIAADAERSAPIRDAIDAERAQREQLIAAGANRHGRRRRERLARRKP
jgi:hypothetical protein